MLRFNPKTHTLEELQLSELKTENILERYDLQKAIVNSWNTFKNEIGYPESFLIGQEIKPHKSTLDSIDLLAFNPEDSSLIVIELKRDRHKLQLLQSLSYAAMLSKWTAEELISRIQKEFNPDPTELIDFINANEINSDIKIILISEFFDPEVIITADWLSSYYSLNIEAFAISLYKLKDDNFIFLDQRYPLKELSDTYEVRSKRSKQIKEVNEISWEEVLPKLKYSFAQKGIELCKKIRSGDPSRRRFGNIRTNYDGFGWISLNFREDYINVYIKGDYEGAQEFLRKQFKEPITINTWRDGFSFLVESENQFNDLVKWLKLE